MSDRRQMQDDIHRPTVVIAGASGFIGTAVCRELVRSYNVVVLTRSSARSRQADPDVPITWLFCDLYSRREVERALAGADYAIYLVHTRMPSARLNQTQSDDMNLLLADNFARAARINRVRQILFLGGMISEESISSRLFRSGNEVEETLSSYGTPLTSLRAGLVVGPGGTFTRLLSHVVLRFPVVLMPGALVGRQQPVSVSDVTRAILYCLGNEEAYGRHLDVCGPDVMTLREILRDVAAVFRKRRFFLKLPFLPVKLYALWFRLLCREADSATVNFLISSFRYDMLEGALCLHDVREKTRIPFRRAFQESIDTASGRLKPNPRITTRTKDEIDLRFESRVRSIYRLPLPNHRNAAWMAETFFRWLPEYLWPLIKCRVDEDGSCHIRLRFFPLHLLTLLFRPDHSTEHRRMYFITRGFLVRSDRGRKARMEFRDVLDNRFTINAIHDYAPRLPWALYVVTQATFHGWVMRSFQKHVDRQSRDSAG